jgi:hypothetical protein
MTSKLKVFCILLLLTILSNGIEAQKFIRLDKINTPITKKFFIGEKFDFTLKAFPDVWRSETILKLDFDSQAIVFDQDLLVIDQIDKVRTYRPWAHTLGVNLYRFSASWFVFGGIIHLTTDYKVDSKTAIIGSSTLALGIILDKLLFKKTHNLGTRWKLRVLDTNF